MCRNHFLVVRIFCTQSLDFKFAFQVFKLFDLSSLRHCVVLFQLFTVVDLAEFLLMLANVIRLALRPFCVLSF